MFGMTMNYRQIGRKKHGVVKPKTRRHLDLYHVTKNKEKVVRNYTNKKGNQCSVTVLTHAATYGSVFKSPPKPKLLLDPKFSRAILVS